MAGPGGGPPRRSHTKSRKGCDTCKRRHIRCDENFPQCRNCTKHKIRCPYNDVPVPEDRAGSPDKPDLMWTPEIEATIDEWRRTGMFPFPSLGIYPAPAPESLSVEDLRLIHHVASISHQMQELDAIDFTLWTRQIPIIIKIGATHRYVLHALLAFSAMHLAYLTGCPAVGNMAYEHRGVALKGLQEAIGAFSRETSDAILAASLVLSWQATDWRSWTQLMQGTSSVIEAMDPWKHESQFGDFIAESSTFPTAPPSPRPDHQPSQPREDDLEAFQRALQQLQKLESFLKKSREDTKPVAQLITFLKGSRKVTSSLSVAQQFDRLKPLRTWLFWLPVMYLQRNGASPSALVVIAHYYTAALLMERLFPEIGAAYFGSMTIGPVEEIARRLYAIRNAGHLQGDLQTPLNLMEFPIETVNEFRSRMGWVQPVRTPSFPQFDTPSVYVGEGSPLMMSASANVSAEYLPYGDNVAFSYSTEDLSVIPESGPSNAISPLQLSSPYVDPHYLNIPSPSYGGYSPASSTYGGDFGDGSPIVYSDAEDTVSYGVDYNYSATSPMLGGANTYGVGPSHLSTSPDYPPPEDLHSRLPAQHQSFAPSPLLSPAQTLLPVPESPSSRPVSLATQEENSLAPSAVLSAPPSPRDKGKGKSE
ncbi:e1196b81-abe7-4cc1-b87d-6d8621d9401a [Thermothielavioides terrestris]|uniref:E1196b81-abe7-4cc1-b87d-6d8621d9401a n=1 Tax=Thermothielavioides terrestris TaxID=2587410 RepID=A0A3S5CWL1_9PEZI|nr:e1196b81-abe7-4cc1-b87d-6d8621d9401a [Thermothielavioides terrestris]